jgi:hypothetical protein
VLQEELPGRCRGGGGRREGCCRGGRPAGRLQRCSPGWGGRGGAAGAGGRRGVAAGGAGRRALRGREREAATAAVDPGERGWRRGEEERGATVRTGVSAAHLIEFFAVCTCLPCASRQTHGKVHDLGFPSPDVCRVLAHGCVQKMALCRVSTLSKRQRHQLLALRRSSSLLSILCAMIALLLFTFYKGFSTHFYLVSMF